MELVLLEVFSRDNQSHDLIGSLKDLMYSQISQYSFNWVLLEVSIASMKLQGVVHNLWEDDLK